MKYRFTTVITQEDQWFIARAVELDVVTQGTTVEDAKKNLIEAVELYLEGDSSSVQRLMKHAPIVTSLEVEYA